MSKHKSIAPSEDLLLQEYRDSGDQKILGDLYNRYLHLVYGLCLKYFKNHEQSQDAVMDIYEQLCQKLLTTEVTHFKSWLYMVSKNHCLMLLRKKNPEVHSEVFMESSDMVHLKEEKIELEQDLGLLEACIEELKEDQKACVKQFFIEQKSYQQIHLAMNMEVKKVKSHIQNGKRNLKICLEGKNVNR